MIHAFPIIEKLIFAMCIRIRNFFKPVGTFVKSLFEFDTVRQAFLPNFFSNVALLVFRRHYYNFSGVCALRGSQAL